MARKRIVLFFEYFNSIHLNKDPFLVPYYLGKMMGRDVEILYPLSDSQEVLPSDYRGVKLVPFTLGSSKQCCFQEQYGNALEYIERQGKEIDVLILFFGSDLSKLFMKRYKQVNPKGKVYIKLDVNPLTIERRADKPVWYRVYRWLRCALWKRPFLWKADVVSCETRWAYEEICKNFAPSKWCDEKLIYVPNGMDEDLIEQLGFSKQISNKKEHVLLTVGRLGAYEKNTEMILAALENVDLKDWKFYFVGSVEKEFEAIKDKFMSNNPQWAQRVVWIGPLYDRKELFQLYERAKVLVMSSRFESYGLVFTEAQRFGDYIISTPVGASYDVIEGGKYGEIVEQENVMALAHAIRNVIEGKTDTSACAQYDVNRLSWTVKLRDVVEKLNRN